MIENTTPPTAEEIAQARENAYNAEHPSTWTWDEAATTYVAPISPPTDGFPYLWDDVTVSWVPFPDYPRE